MLLIGKKVRQKNEQSIASSHSRLSLSYFHFIFFWLYVFAWTLDILHTIILYRSVCVSVFVDSWTVHIAQKEFAFHTRTIYIYTWNDTHAYTEYTRSVTLHYTNSEAFFFFSIVVKYVTSVVIQPSIANVHITHFTTIAWRDYTVCVVSVIVFCLRHYSSHLLLNVLTVEIEHVLL